MQVTYLSKDTQNELIEFFVDSVHKRLLKEIADSKYYAIIVDATPDTARLEHNVFLLKTVAQKVNTETILEFVEKHSKQVML